MRHHGTTVGFAPRLPERLSRLASSVGLLDTCLRVEIEPRHATYELLSGDSLTIRHHGRPVTLDGDKPRRRNSPRTGAPAAAGGGRAETAGAGCGVRGAAIGRPSDAQPQNVDSSVLFTVAYTVPLLDVLANEVTLRLPFFEVNAQV